MIEPRKKLTSITDTPLLNMAIYDRCCFNQKKERKLKNVYRLYIITVAIIFAFCFCAILGSFMELPPIWNITDIFNGLMIFPNLAAIIVLSPEVFGIIKKKERR